MTALVLAARLVLAAVFAVAGAAKLRDRHGTALTLEQFGVPARAAAPAAVTLPLAELAVAGLLVLDPTAVAGAAGALALLGAFSAAIAASLARGERPDCNCFGQLHSQPVGAWTLARNATLALPAFLIVSEGARGAAAGLIDDLGSLDTATTLAAVALAVAVVALALQGWIALHLMRQHGRLLLRLDDLAGAAPAQPAPRRPGLPVGAPAPDGGRWCWRSWIRAAAPAGRSRRSWPSASAARTARAWSS